MVVNVWDSDMIDDDLVGSATINLIKIFNNPNIPLIGTFLIISRKS